MIAKGFLERNKSSGNVFLFHFLTSFCYSNIIVWFQNNLYLTFRLAPSTARSQATGLLWPHRHETTWSTANQWLLAAASFEQETQKFVSTLKRRPQLGELTGLRCPLFPHICAHMKEFMGARTVSFFTSSDNGAVRTGPWDAVLSVRVFGLTKDDARRPHYEPAEHWGPNAVRCFQAD